MDLMKEIEKAFPIDNVYCLKIENAGNKVYLTIGKQGGVTVSTCKMISKHFRDILPENYDLTVQSPGIGFEIKPKTKAFSYIFLFHNEPVKIFFKQENKNLEATGYLKVRDDGTFFIEKDNENLEFSIDDLIKIKTILKSEV